MTIERRIVAAVTAVAGLAVAAAGQTLVIPPANENTLGTSSVVTMFNSAARSFQFLIPAQDLATVANANTITGFTARTRATGTVPAQTVIFANYDVYIGEYSGQLGVPLNTTFAANVVSGTEVQVRGGQMAIPAGSFPTGGAPNAFGTHIVDFNMSTFQYQPGRNYVMTVRHTGNGTTGPGMDANSNGGNYHGMFASSYTAAVSTSNANYTIVQLQLTNSGTCYANCDGSTQEPILNVADFSCFLSKFASADPYGNCDGSTQEPVLNVADFSCFLGKFAAGCP